MDTIATFKNDKNNTSSPQSDNKLILRPEVIGTISDIFSKDVSVVFIEGNSGCGATTALKQFEESRTYVCFSVFLNPASKLSYSADYVRIILTEKIKNYMDDSSQDGGVIEKGEFNTILMRFRSRLRGSYAYFLIDGLMHIPPEDEAEIKQLFSEVLPIGVDHFRFIISGNQSKFSKYLNGAGSKHFQLPRFSFTEISQLFSDFDIPESQLTEIQQACKGNPGSLTSVKRQLQHGKTLRDILTGDNEDPIEFIKKEFSNIDDLTNEQKKIIATITYSKQILELDSIVSICETNDSLLIKTILSCTFLQQNGKYIEFSSNSHRKC